MTSTIGGIPGILECQSLVRVGGGSVSTPQPPGLIRPRRLPVYHSCNHPVPGPKFVPTRDGWVPTERLRPGPRRPTTNTSLPLHGRPIFIVYLYEERPSSQLGTPGPVPLSEGTEHSSVPPTVSTFSGIASGSGTRSHARYSVVRTVVESLTILTF